MIVGPSNEGCEGDNRPQAGVTPHHSEESSEGHSADAEEDVEEQPAARRRRRPSVVARGRKTSRAGGASSRRRLDLEVPAADEFKVAATPTNPDADDGGESPSPSVCEKDGSSDDRQGCINSDGDESPVMMRFASTIEQPLMPEAHGGTRCRRGELWLNDEEFVRVMETLNASTDCGNLWTFVPLGDAARPPPDAGGGGKKKRGRRKIPGLSSNLPGNGSAAGDSEMRGSSRPSMNAEAKGQRVTSGLLKRLPDWGRRMHRLLVALCQQPLAKPFLDEIPATVPNYQNYLEAVQPAQPIALRTVMCKLEHNVYESALQVFNDIYSIWICAFRANEPGSALWLQAHEISQAFSQQVAHQPLKDDFLPTAPAPVSTQGGTKASATAGAPPSNVELLLKELVSVDRQKKSRPSSLAPKGASSSIFTPGPRRAQKGNNRPLSEPEREEFQLLLGKLKDDNHVKLYEEFQSSARWREVEGGEVELDDANTSSSVFRKMMTWCKKKLDIPVPETSAASTKPHKRKAGGHGGQSAAKRSKASPLLATQQRNIPDPTELTPIPAAETSSSPSSSDTSSDSSDRGSEAGDLVS